jgi:hypothetical protein
MQHRPILTPPLVDCLFAVRGAWLMAKSRRRLLDVALDRLAWLTSRSERAPHGLAVLRSKLKQAL